MDSLKFIGTEVRGKTLGVIGLGNVGSEVAKRAHGLEMEVIAYDPVVSIERAELFNVELVALNELLERSDFVTVHVPLVDANRSLVGAPEMALMKAGARLINTARGGIVNEAALVEALKSGRLAAAASDVFENEPPGENPLLALANFVATPHIAASTAEAQVSVAFDVAEEVAAVLAGDIPRFAVNAPALPPEELAYLRPFADLTERLAALHVQLFGGRVGSIELDFEGELAEHDTNLLVASAIKGVLQPFTEDRINSVNARLIASSRGVKLVERRSPAHGSYASLVTVRMGGHELAGTILNGELRAVRIDSFRVDLVPAGSFLGQQARDRPGVVGRFGTILGEHDVEHRQHAGRPRRAAGQRDDDPGGRRSGGGRGPGPAPRGGRHVGPEVRRIGRRIRSLTFALCRDPLLPRSGRQSGRAGGSPVRRHPRRRAGQVRGAFAFQRRPSHPPWPGL